MLAQKRHPAQLCKPCQSTPCSRGNCPAGPAQGVGPGPGSSRWYGGTTNSWIFRETSEGAGCL